MNTQLFTATIRNKKRDGFIRFTLPENCFREDADLTYLYVLLKDYDLEKRGEEIVTSIKIENRKNDIHDSLAPADKNAVTEVALLDANKQVKDRIAQQNDKHSEGWNEKILNFIKKYLPKTATISDTTRFPIQYAPCYREMMGTCIMDIPTKESKALH